MSLTNILPRVLAGRSGFVPAHILRTAKPREPRRMRKLVAVRALLVGSVCIAASVAAGEAPEVEAHLEEAASAGASLARLLERQRPAAGRGCQGKECGPPGMNSRNEMGRDPMGMGQPGGMGMGPKSERSIGEADPDDAPARERGRAASAAGMGTMGGTGQSEGAVSPTNTSASVIEGSPPTSAMDPAPVDASLANELEASLDAPHHAATETASDPDGTTP